MYKAGILERRPGLVLAEVLQRTGGTYEVMHPMLPQFREDIRAVAELTSDEQLLAVAELSEVPISLEHLRHLDPQTRIIMGARLHFTPEESRLL
jgi:hypothetical protein